MQQPQTAARPRLGERVLTAVSRDPLSGANRTRKDAVLAAAVGVLALVLALTVHEGRRPDVLGWALLAGSVVALAWRRSRPMAVLLAVLVCIVPYHAADNTHIAPVPASLVALYTVAATARPLHTFLIGVGVIGTAVTVMFQVDAHQGLETLRTSGWILAVLIFGVDVRTYRRYIASVVGRAERAERTREEEAARRVAEERLRIARDLHDLLAHSITLIGVQTSVASHVLTVDPDRLDRAAIAKALDDITDTCRTARGELRTTLEVLRADGPDAAGPLPDLTALPGLVRAAKADLEVHTGRTRIAPAVEAAAYRIVQESLTNAVRHGGPGVRIRVAVAASDGHLRVTVTDDGTAPGATEGSGYGIAGMRERARSVGGTLAAGPRDGGGYEVAAALPLQQAKALA
ncbi:MULTISPECIES: histidine kinase [unclassified Streptomyces]|uniref:sensor histidine kinase n=1 Tax=unclassified Streptomyces TaxID=2593676 RepID=UPI002DDB7BD6|nr:histidine kinase [Streptomyces sp. NBC_01750]WSB02898.1 histidine kinase [Streptomyces sp. NBC_01794]WSD32830.1 histidine kinase [Streptomyces sp. NBC_01750]